jgi:hypothetical protein
MEAVIVLLLVLLGWMIFVQIAARQQVAVYLGISEQEAAQLTMSYFGRLWTQTPGAGHLNYQPAMRSHAPTISIHFEPSGTAACAVQVWVSSFETARFGRMAHAQLAWRKKQGLARRLRRAGEISPAPEPPPDA